MPQIGFLHFARPIVAAFKLADTQAVDIEARDRKTFARKGNGYGQAHIAQSNDRDFSLA